MNVLITGGSSGIGKAVGEELAKNGHVVFEMSRRDRFLPLLRHFDGDVCISEDLENTVEKMLQAVDSIDLLIANAGFGISGSFEECSEDEIRRQFEVNVFGTINTIKAVLPAMRKQKKGRIILVSSLAGEIPVPFQSYYSDTKACLNSFCLSLNNELRPFNISVHAIMPGDIATEFTDVRVKRGSKIYTRMEQSVKKMEERERNGIPANKLAKKIYRMAIQPWRPRPLSSYGVNYSTFSVLFRLLPRRFSNWLVGKVYG